VAAAEMSTGCIGWAHTGDHAARNVSARWAVAESEKSVDRERVLPTAQRAQRAEDLSMAQMPRMALASAKIRRLRAGTSRGGGDAT
jgi:hypothetical protein